eukprot:2594856-Lingulodinium_polyedra.AAC.1
MHTSGDPREAPAPEWGTEEDDDEAGHGAASGPEDAAAARELPRAVWELSTRAACTTCSTHGACRVRRAAAAASTAR